MPTKKSNNKTINTIKKSAKDINQFVLETSEMIVDETIETGLAWQTLSAKAIKGGLTIAEKQADLTFKALETLKSQWKKGQKKFQAKFS